MPSVSIRIPRAGGPVTMSLTLSSDASIADVEAAVRQTGEINPTKPISVLHAGRPLCSSDTLASLGDAPSKMLTRAVAQKLVADFLGERAPDMDDEGTPCSSTNYMFVTYPVFHCAAISWSSRIALSDAIFASAASFLIAALSRAAAISRA